MKLFYYQHDNGQENFGDDLNPWLWHQLINDELDDDETTAFIGIGTVLNGRLPYRLPNARRFAVFSSGLGYKLGSLPALDSQWHVYCVRGPLSAQQLGIPKRLAIADGALLLRRLFRPTASKDMAFSFMPHLQQVLTYGDQWKRICEQTGIRYINPGLPTEKVLDLVSRTEVLIADAMHGAIAAEALRIPWIPVRTNPGILTFKWMDWCASLGLPYRPHDIFSLCDEIPNADSIYAADSQIYYHRHRCFQQSPMLALNHKESRIEQVASRLLEITKTARPLLSLDCTVEDLTIRLEEQLDVFKQDVKAGKFVSPS